MVIFPYAIHCRTKYGQTGCFIYEEVNDEFRPLSPVFPNLVQLYDYFQEKGYRDLPCHEASRRGYAVGAVSVPGDGLDLEVECLKNAGCQLVSLKEMKARFKDLGYYLDRSLDSRSIALYLDTGRTHPAITTGLVEMDTGRSAFNVDSRRDERFKAMQKLRLELFAVVHSAIFTV